MNKMIFTGELIGIPKTRPDHWKLKRSGEDILLQKHQMYSKWAFNNYNRLRSDYKGSQVDEDVEVTIHFVVRNKSSIDHLLPEFFAILERVFVKSKKQIRHLHTSYEVVNQPEDGQMKPISAEFIITKL